MLSGLWVIERWWRADEGWRISAPIPDLQDPNLCFVAEKAASLTLIKDLIICSHASFFYCLALFLILFLNLF